MEEKFVSCKEIDKLSQISSQYFDSYLTTVCEEKQESESNVNEHINI